MPGQLSHLSGNPSQDHAAKVLRSVSAQVTSQNPSCAAANLTPRNLPVPSFGPVVGWSGLRRIQW